MGLIGVSNPYSTIYAIWNHEGRGRKVLQSIVYDNAEYSDYWVRVSFNFTFMLCISQLGILYKVKIISVFLIQQLFLTNSLAQNLLAGLNPLLTIAP